MGIKEVGNRGLSRHVQQDVVLDYPTRKNIRGKLVFAVKVAEEELVEIVSGGEIGLKHAYPIKGTKEGHYLQSYKIK